MNNWDEVNKLTDVAADSAGSASKRMETYLDSIEAKTKKLKNTWEEFVMNLNQSNSYKNFLDLCIWILNNFPTIIGYFTSLIVIFKGDSISKKLSLFTNLLGSLKEKFGSLKKDLDILRLGWYRNADGILTMASAQETAAATTSMLQLGLGALIAVITAGVQIYNSWKQANVEAAQAAREEADEYGEQANAMEDAIAKYKEIYNSTNDYSTKQEELKNLSEELVTAYGEEAKALDLLNGKYEENVAAMESAANKKRLKERDSLAVAAEKGESNLDNWTNLYWNTDYNLSDKNKYINKDSQFVKDIEEIIKGDEENTGGYFLTNFIGDKYKGLRMRNETTNEQNLKYAQDLQEYYENNLEKMTEGERELLQGFINQIKSEVDKDAKEQYENKQKYQLAEVTQNDDGSEKQEIQEYRKLQKEKQELQEEYNKANDEKEKEDLKRQLGEKEEEIKNSIEKIKGLYNKDDENQSTLSIDKILSYIGVNEEEGESLDNVYSFLNEKQREDYQKIKEEAQESGKLSDDAIKKLQEMRDSLSGEQKENFIKALNNDLDEFNYKIQAAKLELDKVKIQSSYNNATENGHWKNEEEENKFKNTVRENAGTYGVNVDSTAYREAEALLDGTQEGLDKFYEKLKGLIDETEKYKAQLQQDREKEQSTDAEHTYGEGKVGTGSASSFKTYLDDIKDVQAISDKVTDGKVADYDDIEKLRSKTGKAADKMNKKIEEDGKVTAETLQEYIQDTLGYVDEALEKAIDRFDDTCNDIDDMFEDSDAPDVFKEKFEEATDEVSKDLKDDKKLTVGDIEIDSTNLDEVTDAINSATYARENLDEVFSDNSVIDDTIFKMTAMAMGFADGAGAADIMRVALTGVDGEGLNSAWNQLSVEAQQALLQQYAFNDSSIPVEDKIAKLQEMAGNWEQLDVNTRNAIVSMATYFGTLDSAPDDKKKDYADKVGLYNNKIYSLAAAGRNEASYRRGANTSVPKKMGSGSSKGSKNSYSAEDAAEDLADILEDIKDYEADIELDLEDQTEQLINHYNLEKNKLESLKEELDYYEGIYDSVEDTTKWLETQEKLLENQSKTVAELQKSNDKINKQREKIYKENSKYKVSGWFDSEGNDTLAYGDLINSFEYQINAIQKETAKKMRGVYNSVSGSRSETAIENAKDRIEELEKEADRRIEALEKEREKVENIHDSVSELNDAWDENQEAIRDALADMHDRIIDIRDTLVDQLMEQLEKAVDKQNESIEKDVTRMEQLVSIREKYYEILNETIDTQADLDSELQSSLDSFEYLDEQMRQLMFNEEDYKALSETLTGIQEDIAGIWEDHYNKIDSLTDDEMYKAEYITAETERQLDMKMKEYELAKAELDVAKAKTNLQNVQNERNVRMFVNGQWTWVADPDAVKDAQKQLADAEREKDRIEREQEQQKLIDKMEGIIDSDNLQIDENNELLERVQEAIEAQTQEVQSIEDALQNIKDTNLPALNDVLVGAFGSDGKGGFISELLANINKSTSLLTLSLKGYTTASAEKALKSGNLSKAEFEDLVESLGYSFNSTTGKVTTLDGSFSAHYKGWKKQSNNDTQLGTSGNGVQVTGNGSNANGSGGSSSASKFPRTGHVSTGSLPLRIRSGAGTNYKVLGLMPKGAKVTITGEANSGWAKVRYNGINGYASRQYLTYDQGGLATGKGVFLKDINVPERVLSPKQTKSFDYLVKNLTTNPILAALTKNPNIKSNLSGLGKAIGETKQYYFSNFTVQADNLTEFIDSLDAMIPISRK